MSFNLPSLRTSDLLLMQQTGQKLSENSHPVDLPQPVSSIIGHRHHVALLCFRCTCIASSHCNILVAAWLYFACLRGQTLQCHFHQESTKTICTVISLKCSIVNDHKNSKNMHELVGKYEPLRSTISIVIHT